MKIETKEGLKSLLEITHDIYIVPKGEELLVHYTAEQVRHNNDGKRLSHPQLFKSDVRMFDGVMKAQLEKTGYRINILYHPKGTYVPYEPVVDKDAEIAKLKAELAKREQKAEQTADPNEEMEKLKAELAKREEQLAKAKADIAKLKKEK